MLHKMRLLSSVFICVCLFSCSNKSEKSSPEHSPQQGYSDAEIAELVKETEYNPRDIDNSDDYKPKSTNKTDTTTMNKAEKLMWLHDTTVQLSGKEREKFEQLFFNEFPNSFKEYERLYGFDMDSGEMQLYNNTNHIELFTNLQSINKKDYYNKLLNISTDGVWAADNIRDIGVYEILKNDPKAMLKLIDMRSDEEIKSIMRFMYDGPHPDNYQNDFNELNEIIKPINERVSNLMTDAYKGLISEHDGHGH